MTPCDHNMGTNCFNMIILSDIFLSSLHFQALSCNKGMLVQIEGFFIELREGDMGGSSNHIELDEIEDFIRDSEVTLVYLCEGGLLPFMECIEGYDKHVSLQFVNSWANRKVTINDMAFEMTKELISKVCGLCLEKKSWHKKPTILDEMNLLKFFHRKGELVCMCGGFSHEDLPRPWDIMCYTILCYITLE